MHEEMVGEQIISIDCRANRMQDVHLQEYAKQMTLEKYQMVEILMMSDN